jgi:hypothetical protein
LGSATRTESCGDDAIEFEPYQLCRSRRMLGKISPSKAPLYEKVFSLNISKLPQTLSEGFFIGSNIYTMGEITYPVYFS